MTRTRLAGLTGTNATHWSYSSGKFVVCLLINSRILVVAHVSISASFIAN
jgi:hypothetical protein